MSHRPYSNEVFDPVAKAIAKAFETLILDEEQGVMDELYQQLAAVRQKMIDEGEVLADEAPEIMVDGVEPYAEAGVLTMDQGLVLRVSDFNVYVTIKAQPRW